MKVTAPEVLREFPSIGKYRIRLMKRRDNQAYLDIREYVQSEKFEGFTRRGVKIASTEDVNCLRATIVEIIASNLL